MANQKYPLLLIVSSARGDCFKFEVVKIECLLIVLAFCIVYSVYKLKTERCEFGNLEILFESSSFKRSPLMEVFSKREISFKFWSRETLLKGHSRYLNSSAIVMCVFVEYYSIHAFSCPTATNLNWKWFLNLIFSSKNSLKEAARDSVSHGISGQLKFGFSFAIISYHLEDSFLKRNRSKLAALFNRPLGKFTLWLLRIKFCAPESSEPNH